ncbi:MAG TPA: cytochrome P460 family protein [Fimbriimonadaceae bacterium]|nr:cytochrome P460 family protein [Fimbriimonadaceae bacterium]
MKVLVGSLSIFVGGALFAGFPGATDARLKAIQGYRSWTKVNAKPVSMAPSVAVLCAAIPPPKWRDPSPHIGKFFTVYVNATGRTAMLSDETKPFPVGTVIVKEKVPAVGQDVLKQTPGTKVELLTVMIKRDKGFDPGNGDWEYFAVSGDAKAVISKDVKHCQDCHRSQKSSDYVYRDYPRSASRR